MYGGVNGVDALGLGTLKEALADDKLTLAEARELEFTPEQTRIILGKLAPKYYQTWGNLQLIDNNTSILNFSNWKAKLAKAKSLFPGIKNEEELYKKFADWSNQRWARWALLKQFNAKYGKTADAVGVTAKVYIASMDLALIVGYAPGMAKGFAEFLGKGSLSKSYSGQSALSKNKKAPNTASRRTNYAGATPGKTSKTGKEVIARMTKEGKIRTTFGGKKEFLAGDGFWYPLDKADMAHKTDLVTWWNSVGRNYGPKSDPVRSFMLNSDNYYLELYRINRSQGATLGQTEKYLGPLRYPVAK